MSINWKESFDLVLNLCFCFEYFYKKGSGQNISLLLSGLIVVLQGKMCLFASLKDLYGQVVQILPRYEMSHKPNFIHNFHKEN